MVETELGKRPSVSQLEDEVQVAVCTTHARSLRQVLGERAWPLTGGWRRSGTFGPRSPSKRKIVGRGNLVATLIVTTRVEARGLEGYGLQEAVGVLG